MRKNQLTDSFMFAMLYNCDYKGLLHKLSSRSVWTQTGTSKLFFIFYN